MKRIILIMTLLLNVTGFAQTKSELEASEDKELATYMNSNFIKEYKPEVNEPLIIQGDKRITLAYFSAMMPSEFGTITDYEFQFAYNMGHYWLETVIGQGGAKFGTIGSNSSSSSSSSSEGNFFRDEEVQENYLYLGVGPSLRSRHLASFFGFDRVYETFHGYLTYHALSEELRSEDYAGFGARADASINYLLSSTSHLGVKFSFGYSALKRAAATESEASSQRSLMFRWNRLGLDYSFYF